MGNWFSSYDDEPDSYNPTNAEIERYNEMVRQANEARAKAEAETAAIKQQADETAQRVAEARNREDEAHRRAEEARQREVDTLKREHEAKLESAQAQLELERAKQRGEESERQRKEAAEKEAEAKRRANESERATLEAQKREREANARVVETQKQVEEARTAENAAREREKKVQKDLDQAEFFLSKGIQPEIWPTKDEFESAKKRIQYDPEKLHFAVCGSSGSGKSSLVNAFRGMKNNNFQAARTGIVETTMTITRYPDPRRELPYKRFIWFDCPGAGTLEIPGWQYFNEQGLFIFDIIVLVYDTRFTQIDVSIIENCERFNIPLFIVRSKADGHIRNIMQDLGYDETDEDARDVYHDYQARARQLLIDTTRDNLEKNLEKAKLPKREVFIVSGSVVFSVVTNKGNRRSALAIDEARLMETILTIAHARRYGNQAPAKDHSTLVNGQ